MSTVAVNHQPNPQPSAIPSSMPPPTPAELREEVIEALLDQGYKLAAATTAVNCCSGMEFSGLFRECLLWMRAAGNVRGKARVPAQSPAAKANRLYCSKECGRRVNKNNKLGICAVCRTGLAQEKARDAESNPSSESAVREQSGKAAQRTDIGEAQARTYSASTQNPGNAEPQAPPVEVHPAHQFFSAPMTIATAPEARSPKPEALDLGLAAQGSTRICAGYKKTCTQPLGAKNRTGLCPLCSARRRYAEGQGTAPERQCACGAKLRRDNRSGVCIHCQNKMGRREFREVAQTGVSRNPVSQHSAFSNKLGDSGLSGLLPVLLSEPQIVGFLERMPDWKDFVRRLPTDLKLLLVNHYFAEAAAA